MPSDIGFRRIVVLVTQAEESERSVDVACRLASSHGATITMLAVVEIPRLLPFDAHMRKEEQRAHEVVERNAAMAERYDVRVARRVVRARDAAAAIVAEAEATKCELIVLGALSGRTVERVLKYAPSRVMLMGEPRSTLAAFTVAA